MGKTKIAITMDAEFIGELDRLIEKNYFQNRSQAICDAVRERLAIAVDLTRQPQKAGFPLTFELKSPN